MCKIYCSVTIHYNFIQEKENWVSIRLNKIFVAEDSVVRLCNKEAASDPRALALKADELFQSRISSPVNLLADHLKDIQVNAVSTRSRLSPSS